MILPQSYLAALLVILLCLLCWGSWPNTVKLGGRRRYELYYFDWILGALVVAVVAAFTLGSLGYDGFSFSDDMMIAGKRSWVYAFVSGVIFNIGNLLLLSSMSLAGMAVAFPIGAGVGFIVGGIVEFAAHRSGPVTFLLMGSGLLAGAVVTAGLAYRRMVDLQHEALARAGKAKSTRRPAAAKPILLAGIGGLFLSSFWPLIDRAREGEVGLGPYSLSVLFVAGIALSGYILNLFFMNLPVEGEPIEMLQYFKDSFGSHVPGFVGGVLWCLGLVAVLIATAPMLPLPLNPALSYTLSHAGVLLVMFWGALVWKELAGADGRVKLLEVLTALLLAGGIVVVAVAPLYARIAG